MDAQIASASAKKPDDKRVHPQGIALTPNTILTSVATAMLLWVGYSMHNVKVDVAVLKSNMTTLLSREARIERLEKWQRDWPQTGRLQEDVRQNARLDQMDKQIEELRMKGPQ